MAEMTHVDDLDDPRLGDYVRLRDVQLRTKLESERGIYLAEGEKVVRSWTSRRATVRGRS